MLPQYPLNIRFIFNGHTEIHEYQIIENILDETADNYAAKQKGCYIECIREY